MIAEESDGIISVTASLSGYEKSSNVGSWTTSLDILPYGPAAYPGERQDRYAAIDTGELPSYLKKVLGIELWKHRACYLGTPGAELDRSVGVVMRLCLFCETPPEAWESNHVEVESWQRVSPSRVDGCEELLLSLVSDLWNVGISGLRMSIRSETSW